jgi:hypothetical protein
MPQYTDDGGAMFNICPCCGFQAGFDDDAILEPLTIEEYRLRWVKSGANWFSYYHKKPDDFNLERQLLNIGIRLNEISKEINE